MFITLYLDGLLNKLQQIGSVCHIGRTYCGLFGNADNLAIVSIAINIWIENNSICEHYANEFLFNLKKSKLIYPNMPLDVKPSLTLCGQVTDVVDNEIYLGSRMF